MPRQEPNQEKKKPGRPPKMATCHPDRKHYANDFCIACYRREQRAEKPDNYEGSELAKERRRRYEESEAGKTRKRTWAKVSRKVKKQQQKLALREQRQQQQQEAP
jgi:hypothetical protein